MHILLFSELVLEQHSSTLNSVIGVMSLVLVSFPLMRIASGIFMTKKTLVSSFMVRYFTLFNWVLFIPLTYLFTDLIDRSGTSTVGGVSGYFGLPLTILTSFMVTYIFRNHQFMENNLIRKK
jgi:hypothetical protein